MCVLFLPLVPKGFSARSRIKSALYEGNPSIIKRRSLSHEMEWGCDAFCSKMDFSVVDVITHEANSYSKVTHTVQKTIMNNELKKGLNNAIEDRKKGQKEKQQKDKEQKKTGVQGDGKGKRGTVWEA